MALCCDCSAYNNCVKICKDVEKEIVGRGRTAEKKPRTYTVDFNSIHSLKRKPTDFQLDVLKREAQISLRNKNKMIARLALEEIFKRLTEKEIGIFRLLKEGYTQEEIGKVLGISQVAIHLIIKKAKEKIKVYLER